MGPARLTSFAFSANANGANSIAAEAQPTTASEGRSGSARPAGHALRADRVGCVARPILWGSLVLTPVVLAAHYAFDAGETVLFVLAAAALVPLAWLIGESTEHAAEHTGPGIGGFLNASFGNAPELIIALFAIADGLPNVVRGSLAGRVIGNLLLVLGFALIIGPERIDRRSLVPQLGLIGLAVLLFLIPSVPAFHGDRERHSLALVSAAVAAVLLAIYVGERWAALRRHREAHTASGHEASSEFWSMPVAIAVLAVATAATAFVSEILVHSIDAFAHAAGLSQFFVSAIIVAIVGNAAEHGGAVVIAARGKLMLASEIAVTSSAQVALLVAPAVMVLSFLVRPALPLAFRWEELVGMAVAVGAVGAVVADGRGKRWEGIAIVALYGAIAVWYGLAD
jgi:Ca2+:H+ antiporter